MGNSDWTKANSAYSSESL